MCGIFGFSGFQEEGLLRRMARLLVHRGPDGEGFFEQPDFSMGMRRLSIIDLEGGTQPIYNEDRSLAVCYNGEIYNYVELRALLEAKGHRFTTHSDTEVIVHAYEEWGVECLQRFNGMFAFALRDLRQRSTFIARDRCGQKPLYYHHKNGRFLFASEVKALLASTHVERRCNLNAIDPYLALRNVPEPETMFEGISTLRAGHYLLLKDDRLEIRRYWDIRLHEGEYDSDDSYLEQLEAKFFDSVKLTMRSDVPVGAYLSGGVDSSLIVAAMCRLSERVNTFSVGFNSPIDETHDARELAAKLGTTHHEINCAPADFELLPRIVYQMDRPVGDALIIAFYKLAEATSRDLKVALSGEGADEIFAGYSFQKVMNWTETYRRFVPDFVTDRIAVPLLEKIPAALLTHGFVFPAALGEKGKERVVDYLKFYARRNLNENFLALRTLTSRTERAGLYAPEFKARATDAWIAAPRDTSGPFLDRLLKLQFDEWLQDWSLIRQEKNTMAHSLELREPFLDHELIELAFRMPPHLKSAGFKDKIIERRLARKLLPPASVNRTKKPFYFPVEFFTEHKEFRDLVALTLSPERIKRRGYFDPEAVRQLLGQIETREFLHLKQVMSLVILELWHMVFIDQELRFEPKQA